MNDLIKKFTVGLVGLAMVASLVPVVPSAYATQPTPTIAELQRQIAALTAQLQALQAPAQAPAVTIEGVPAGFTFARNLRLGMTGPDVRNLQIILNADPATRVAVTGVGSPGRETNFFGPATRAAVVKFQTENEISPAAGFVGPRTRVALNALLVVAPGVPGVPGVPVIPGIPVVSATPTAVLSPVTPVAAALPLGARMVPVLTVNVTAGTEALTISAMRFKRTGSGEPTDWSNLHLFEGGVRITDFGRSISADTHEIEFPTLAITIPAGQTRSYTLRANVAGVTGIAGRQGAFELIGITSNIAIPGLPVRGNLMNITSVAVSAVTINPGLLPVSPMVGARNVEIASLRVIAGANAVALEQIAVAVGGNIRRGDVTNLRLYHGTTRLATTPALSVHDKAVFVLSPAFNIVRERTETLTVRADLAGRVGETILTRIADAEDVIAIDQRLGFGAQITNNVSTAGALGNIALLGGRLTLADQGPAARNVAVNTSDVVLTQIGMTAERNLEVRRLVVNIPGGAHTLISNLRIRDAVTGETLMGPTTPAAVNNMIGSFTLTAGVTRNITVTANTLAVAGGVSANLVADLGNANVDIRDIGTGAPLVAADVVPHTVTGKTQTIVVAGLTAGLLGAPIPATVVTGAANVPAVGFSLAAVGADVTVRSLEARIFVNTAINFAPGATEVTDPNRVVTLARLMDGTTVLGTAVLSNVSDAHDYGRVRFTGLNLRITRETARNLTVQISAGSGLTVTNHVAVSVLGATANVIDAVDAENRTVTVAGNVNLVVPNTPPARVITITTAGTLAAVRAAGSPVAAIIPVGITQANNQTLTLVRFTTEREPIIIEELRVSRDGSAPETAYLAVDLVDGATVLGSGVFGHGATTLDLRGLNVEIPIAGRILGLRANLAGVGVGVTSGETVQLNAQIIRARGANSGALIFGTPVVGNLGATTPAVATPAAAPAARAARDIGTPPNQLRLVADVIGAVGNTITYTATIPTAINQPFALSVAGNAITVSLATGPTAGITISTNAHVRDALNANAHSAALIDASVLGADATLATAIAATPLVGGSDGAREVRTVTIAGDRIHVGSVVTVALTGAAVGTVSRTVVAGDDLTSIATALSAGIHALVGVDATSALGVITITAEAVNVPFTVVPSVSNTTIHGVIAVVEGHPMTIRQTVPTVAKLANQTVLTGTNDVVLNFTVAAHAAGDVVLRNIPINFTGTGPVVTAANALAGARLYRGLTQIDASETGGVFNLAVGPTTLAQRTIAAGTTVNFTVRADGGTPAAGNTLLARILEDINFHWNDGSVDVGTGVLVPGLPITGDTLVRP